MTAAVRNIDAIARKHIYARTISVTCSAVSHVYRANTNSVASTRDVRVASTRDR